MRYRSYDDKGSIFGIDLAPRSLYVMKADIRWQWEHSILPVKDKRYSVTLRTLADKGARRAQR